MQAKTNTDILIIRNKLILFIAIVITLLNALITKLL